MTMELTQLRNIIEGALLAAGQPLNINRLKSLFEEGEAPETDQFKAALEMIAADCEGRGFELKEVGSGWRFQVRPDMAPWINRLWEEKPQKYSRALLETLALVAYRQPITRGDIEEIRGVAVSSHIIKTLVEREWIKVVGHRDVPGRPSLYATTRQFLDYFNLKNLEELPSLGEIRDLNDINSELDLGADAPPTDETQEDTSGDEAAVESEASAPETEAAPEHEPEAEYPSDPQAAESADDTADRPGYPDASDSADEQGPVVAVSGDEGQNETTQETDAELRQNPEADQSTL